MKVKCTWTSGGNNFTVGKMYDVDKNGFALSNSEDCNFNFEDIQSWNWYKFEPIAPDTYELHITCNDGKTTNAIYKRNGKIEKRTQAVCNPSDTFDFETGLRTAIDRMFVKATQPTPCVEPTEDKPNEPIKLYCVKSEEPRTMTAGNIYEVDGNGYMHWDSRRSECTYQSMSDVFRVHPQLKGRLIPLVKRPAVVGEWVLITNACEFLERYKNGDIFKVTRKWDIGIDVGEKFDMFDDEYLVLDNYHPEPEKVEPVYYSGVVRCVKGGLYHTNGMLYEVKRGIVNDNDNKLDYHEHPCKTIAELNEQYEPRFEEFKGEQSC